MFGTMSRILVQMKTRCQVAILNIVISNVLLLWKFYMDWVEWQWSTRGPAPVGTYRIVTRAKCLVITSETEDLTALN